jgi:DNA-binding CsgD family transcriptional regulator
VTTPLTDREEQVRSLVATGLTTDEVAARLSISKRTVEAHLHSVFRKLGVTRRSQLVFGFDRTSSGSALIPAEGDVDLVAENQRLTRQIASYDAAIQQIISRQFPLFEERSEITVMVGSGAGDDTVVERHWTKPKPYLPYRVTRPIRARGAIAVSYDDLGVTCEVVGQDVGVIVQPVLEPNERLLVLVFFQPGLRESTEWVLHYRSPGLFDELRATGDQDLVWSTNTLDYPSTPGIGEVTFFFEFLDSEDGNVRQERQTGDMKEDRLPGGTRFVWHNFVPGRHVWTLQMTARRQQ